MSGILKIDKKNVKEVIGGILGGEEEKELCLIKSYNKFKNLKKNAERYRDVFILLSRSRTLSKFDKENDLINSYIDNINNDLDLYFGNPPPVDDLIKMYPLIPNDKKNDVYKFLKYYNLSKKSPIIHTIINTCGNLVSYKQYLKDKDSLSDKFLTKSSMLTFEPIVELPLNFKLLYISDLLDDIERKFILLSLHKIYNISVNLYDEYSKVDIDTEQFVKAVNITVEKLKKQIPRCDEAFKKILDSTDLLKNNYDDYYKDYVGSQNSMIIAENFIQDVAGTVDKSPKLALQFRKIIQHLKDMTTKIIAKEPKYKETFGSLLDHADQSYKEIRKNLEDDGEVFEEEDEEEDIKCDLSQIFKDISKDMVLEEGKEGKEEVINNINLQVDKLFNEDPNASSDK